MSAFMGASMLACVNACMKAGLNEHIHACMHARMHLCMHAYMPAFCQHECKKYRMHASMHSNQLIPCFRTMGNHTRARAFKYTPVVTPGANVCNGGMTRHSRYACWCLSIPTRFAKPCRTDARGQTNDPTMPCMNTIITTCPRLLVVCCDG